jgi:hypothetical protein
MAEKKGETPKSRQLPQIGENHIQYMPPELMDKILSNIDQASRKNFRQADHKSWHDMTHKDNLDLLRARTILGNDAAPYTNPQLLSRLYHLNGGKSADATGIVIDHYIEGGQTYQTGAAVEKWSKKKFSITIIYYTDIPAQVDEEKWQVDDSYYRVDGPALIRFYKSGQKRSETWYLTKGMIYRPDGYGQTIYYKNGKIKSQYFFGEAAPGGSLYARMDPARLKNLQSIMLKGLADTVAYAGGEYAHNVMYDIGITGEHDDLLDLVSQAYLEAILKLDITGRIKELINEYPDPEGNAIDMDEIQEVIIIDFDDDERVIDLTKEIFFIFWNKRKSRQKKYQNVSTN